MPHYGLVNKLIQPDENWVACAACFVQKTVRVKAKYTANGYSCCEQHLELVCQPGFQLAKMKRAV